MARSRRSYLNSSTRRAIQVCYPVGSVARHDRILVISFTGASSHSLLYRSLSGARLDRMPASSASAHGAARYACAHKHRERRLAAPARRAMRAPRCARCGRTRQGAEPVRLMNRHGADRSPVIHACRAARDHHATQRATRL